MCECVGGLRLCVYVCVCVCVCVRAHCTSLHSRLHNNLSFSTSSSLGIISYFSHLLHHFLGSTIISFLLAIFSGEFFEGISFLLNNSDVSTWLSFIAFCSFGYCGANFGAALTHQVWQYVIIYYCFSNNTILYNFLFFYGCFQLFNCSRNFWWHPLLTFLYFQISILTHLTTLFFSIILF